MKALFIESRRKPEKLENLDKLEKLGNIHILYSIQYKKIAEKIKHKLKNQVKACEQVLGCTEIKPKAETLLFIGDGQFHALQLALTTGKPVYVYNTKTLEKISQKQVDTINALEKGKLIKFYHASSLGLLVSTKPGQYNLSKALKFKHTNKNKKSYIFLSDAINPEEFENFLIDMWVNFACPRLENSKIINYKKIKK